MQRSSIRMLLLLVLLASACGSGDDEGMDSVEGPLPTGVEDPAAYSEVFFAQNPRAQVRKEHLVVLQLEPGDIDGPDTCSDRDGVDCVPYLFDTETPVELLIDEGASYIGQLVLIDESGAVVARRTYGSEPAPVIVGPGSYRLEVHHAFKGDPNAATYTTFVRAVLEPASELDRPANALTLMAEANCIRCNFSNARLERQNFDGLELTGSAFDGATILKTTFRGAMMVGCSLHGLTGYGLISGRPRDREKPEFDADFSGANLTGSHFSFLEIPPDAFVGLFRDATLDATVWKMEKANENICYDPSGLCSGGRDEPDICWNQICPSNFDSNIALKCYNSCGVPFSEKLGRYPPGCIDTSRFTICSSLTPDFRNASLPAAQFSAVRLLGSSCTFQGADLTAASFRTSAPGAIGSVLHCRFDREPESGKTSVMRGVDLGGVLACTNLSEADLSGAILEGTAFNHEDYCSVPANLSHADLSNALITGAVFRGANLSGAVLAGIRPPTLNGFDLRGTNFSGVMFAGLDLSQTDLSGAILFAGGAASFIGAKLSNGTQGVTMAGQRFPPRFADFKGADLIGADLRGADLIQANLEKVMLNEARLVGTNFNFANLHGAKLSGATLGVTPGMEGGAASLRGAFMTDIDLSDADLRSVDLTGAHLYGDATATSLVRTRLDSANLSETICSGAHFSGTLNDAVFNRAQLVNTDFNGATLTEAKFDDTYLQGADFSNAIGVNGVTLSNAAVSAEPGFWDFKESDGTPYVVRYEATKLGALATNRSIRCPDGSLGPCCPKLDLAECLATGRLKPERDGPYPPKPDCVPRPPKYDNCITPSPTLPLPPTPTPR